MTDRTRMTKAERDDLIRLVKQRERLAKTAAKQRSAAMLAEFEQKISAIHDFATNDVWKAATDAAVEAANRANEEVDAEAARLGIPKEFRPTIRFVWNRRGQAEYEERRNELRKVAKAEIDALEKVALVQVETESVKAQTEIIANGLASPDAIAFLQSLPDVEKLMPTLDAADIQRKLAEQARQKGGHSGFYLVDD